MVQFLKTGPDNGPAIVLAHGSGAPMDSHFMEQIALIAADHGIQTVRFEFAYMAQRRAQGSKRPPPRAELLMREFIEAIDAVDRKPLFIGGKSLGGRMASMIADELHRKGVVRGLVCLGYPFHPPGKPEKLRTAHLEKLACPCLIVQGENDPFGKRAEVEALKLSGAIRTHWCPDGNHDLVPPKRSGRTGDQNWQDAIAAVSAFMHELEEQ